MKRALSPTLGALLAIALLAAPAATAAPVATEPSSAVPEVAGTPAAAPGSQEPVISLAPRAAESPESLESETPLRVAELPNLHRVDDKLWRGGEPKGGGIARLKELGVDTVLDLRWEDG